MSNIFDFKISAMSDYGVRYYFGDGEDISSSRAYPFHMHDAIEIFILLKGEVSFAVESSLYKLSAGDAIVTKPNEMHNCIVSSDSRHEHLCLWFNCDSDFLFGDFISHGFGKNNLLSPDGSAKERLYELCSELGEASCENDTYRRFYITLQILYVLKKFISDKSEAQPLPEVLKNILNDIEENFTVIDGIEDIVSRHFISRSTLNRMFRKYLNTTPKKYIESKRLAYSRILLREGKSVIDACTESGFSDCSNYIRLFKKHFSTTPRQYKNNEKNEEE